MGPGHPQGLPDLFLDRSLGRRQVTDLLRAAGLRLQTLAEVYGIPADVTNGNLRAAEMAECYLTAIEQIARSCRSTGPFLYAVSTGGVRRLDL